LNQPRPDILANAPKSRCLALALFLFRPTLGCAI
jgi:hypothetical protein